MLLDYTNYSFLLTGGCHLVQVKTHLQTQSATIGVGHQHSHRGLAAALATIYRRHGARGLWRGSVSGLPRVMVGSATQLTTFSAAREAIDRAQVAAHRTWGRAARQAQKRLCGVVAGDD